MIVRCIWHKPIPVYLREKPPFEDKRVSDGMCEECMRKMFEKAGMKPQGEREELGEPPSTGREGGETR